MITKEQYEAAKKIVDEYEYCERMQGYMDSDDDFDEDDWEEDERDREEEERAERAANCRCGAWVYKKEGTVFRVADCCCGAE